MNKMVRDQDYIKMARDEEITKKHREIIQKFKEIMQRYENKDKDLTKFKDYIKEHDGIIRTFTEYINSGKFKDLELTTKYNELIQWKLQNNMRL